MTRQAGTQKKMGKGRFFERLKQVFSKKLSKHKNRKEKEKFLSNKFGIIAVYLILLSIVSFFVGFLPLFAGSLIAIGLFSLLGFAEDENKSAATGAAVYLVLVVVLLFSTILIYRFSDCF
ncbi:MAG: hypothetical protein AAFZ15_30405 [Bacteroidota bacterium]